MKPQVAQAGVSHSLNWNISEPKETLFSQDVVIDAYLKGKKEGLKIAERASWELLSTNINKSADCTAKVLAELKSRNFGVISAHLRICSLEGFNVIIVVKEEDFLSDAFLDIYSFIGVYENTINEELFHLCFSFMDGDKKFNLTRLKADGFHLTYKE